MIKYKVKYSSEFKKNLKKLVKQRKNINKLFDVIDVLSVGGTLGYKYKDHALNNDKRFNECRDCHIEPDWILIYKYYNDELILLLVNTGSHSNLFNL